MTPNPKTSMEERLKQLLIKQGALISENDESGQQIYEEQLAFIKAELEANDKQWRERIKGMKLENPGGFGQLKFNNGEKYYIKEREMKIINNVLDSLLERKEV